MARAPEATAEAVAATAAVVAGGRRGVEGAAMQHRGDDGNDRRVMERNSTWSSDGPARSSETRSLAPPCTINGARTGTGGPSGADRADHRASCGRFHSTCPKHTSDTRIRAQSARIVHHGQRGACRSNAQAIANGQVGGLGRCAGGRGSPGRPQLGATSAQGVRATQQPWPAVAGSVQQWTPSEKMKDER